MDIQSKIYEQWAEEKYADLTDDLQYIKQEAYTAALEDKLEDVCLSYAEWNEKYGFMWDNDGYSSDDKFNHFINNIYNV